MLNMTPNDMPSSPSSSSAPTLEAGVYPGVISLIMDLGIQKDKKYDSRMKDDDICTDDDYNIGHQLWFSFCLPTERYEVEQDGEVVERDMLIGKKFLLSKSDKSNLIKMYRAVVKDGRTFGQMIGMPVTVTTGLTSGGKAKVVSIAGPMRGTSVGEPLDPPMLVDEDKWNEVDSLNIPEFLKEMIHNRLS